MGNVRLMAESFVCAGFFLTSVIRPVAWLANGGFFSDRFGPQHIFLG